MGALQIAKNENTEVVFLSDSKTIILKLKGIVSKYQLKSLRSNVLGMFSSLGANKLVMNTLESEYQEFDFTDDDRKTFYKRAEQNGIKRLEIIYPNQNFIQEVKNQWMIFFNQNEIKIRVSASVL